MKCFKTELDLDSKGKRVRVNWDQSALNLKCSTLKIKYKGTWSAFHLSLLQYPHHHNAVPLEGRRKLPFWSVLLSPQWTRYLNTFPSVYITPRIRHKYLCSQVKKDSKDLKGFIARPRGTGLQKTTDSTSGLVSSEHWIIHPPCPASDHHSHHSPPQLSFPPLLPKQGDRFALQFSMEFVPWHYRVGLGER